MIRIKVMGDFDHIIELIEGLSRPDLMPLAARVRDVMIEDNREGLLAGTNADGSRAARLAPSTIKRRGGATGPPRIPHDSASRMIADYDVDIRPTADRIVLIGGWRNTPWVHFHASGAPANNMPARDPVGIRPAGQEQVRMALREFVEGLARRFR